MFNDDWAELQPANAVLDSTDAAKEALLNCKICHIPQPVSNFYIDTRSNRPLCVCKTCHKNRRDERRKEQRESESKQREARNARKRRVLREVEVEIEATSRAAEKAVEQKRIKQKVVTPKLPKAKPVEATSAKPRVFKKDGVLEPSPEIVAAARSAIATGALVSSDVRLFNQLLQMFVRDQFLLLYDDLNYTDKTVGENGNFFKKQTLLKALQKLLVKLSEGLTAAHTVCRHKRKETDTHLPVPRTDPVKLQEAYAVLGLAFGTAFEEVKKVYKNKAQEAHPDRNGGSTDAMQRLNAAYELLKERESTCPES